MRMLCLVAFFFTVLRNIVSHSVMILLQNFLNRRCDKVKSKYYQ